MEKQYIIFDGIKFRETSNHHHIAKKNNKPIYLHRYIWEKQNGDIPSGMVIHHKDCNPHNNNISNLQLMTISEHVIWHNKNTKIDRSGYIISEESRKRISDAWKNKKRSQDKLRKYILSMPKVKCPFCGKEGKNRGVFKHYHFDNCKENKQ